MKISYDERYRQIAKWIIYYRKIKGLTQETLSAKVGISKSYLSKIEAPNSTKAYSLDVLFAIADALDIDVIRFFLPYEKSELHKLQFICDCSVIFAHNKKPLWKSQRILLIYGAGEPNRTKLKFDIVLPRELVA